jgi:orotate phosphoribosyltransferase
MTGCVSQVAPAGSRSSSSSSAPAIAANAVIDDVVSSGATSREVIEFVKQEGGEPVLVIVVINKRAENELDGVPLHALVRARPVGT